MAAVTPRTERNTTADDQCRAGLNNVRKMRKIHIKWKKRYAMLEAINFRLQKHDSRTKPMRTQNMYD